MFFTEAQELQPAVFLAFEKTCSDEPHLGDPSLHLVTATKKQLEQFLGKQAHLLSKRVHLLEVFAGEIANTSKQVETHGGNAIRIGIAYGQDLSTTVNRALLLELIKYARPEHVLFAWQCTSVAGFSELNYVKHEQSRTQIDHQRRLVGHWVNMWCDAYMIQHANGRFCHAENPVGSRAWSHPRITTMPDMLFAVFDQYIATNSPDMFKETSKRCDNAHQREVL